MSQIDRIVKIENSLNVLKRNCFDQFRIFYVRYLATIYTTEHVIFFERLFYDLLVPEVGAKFRTDKIDENVIKKKLDFSKVTISLLLRDFAKERILFQWEREGGKVGQSKSPFWIMDLKKTISFMNSKFSQLMVSYTHSIEDLTRDSEKFFVCENKSCCKYDKKEHLLSLISIFGSSGFCCSSCRGPLVNLINFGLISEEKARLKAEYEKVCTEASELISEAKKLWEVYELLERQEEILRKVEKEEEQKVIDQEGKDWFLETMGGKETFEKEKLEKKIEKVHFPINFFLRYVDSWEGKYK